MSSTVKNADLWTVTFYDANGTPATPSTPISWWINQGSRWYDIDGNELEPEYLPNRRVNLDSVIGYEQDVNEAVSTGVYQIKFTPPFAVPYRVKAAAIVGGEDQAVPFTRIEVDP